MCAVKRIVLVLVLIIFGGSAGALLLDQWLVHESSYSNSVYAVFIAGVLLPLLTLLLTFRNTAGVVKSSAIIIPVSIAVVGLVTLFYGEKICAWFEIPMVTYLVYPGAQINTVLVLFNVCYSLYKVMAWE